MYADDIGYREGAKGQRRLDAAVSPVMVDWTRPIKKMLVWNLIGNDQTLVIECLVTLSSASDHHLIMKDTENRPLRSRGGKSKEETRGEHRATRCRGLASGQPDRRIRSARVSLDRGANGSIRGGSLFKPHG